jgi:DNA-binding transcriptional ArsR family regulator
MIAGSYFQAMPAAKHSRPPSARARRSLLPPKHFEIVARRLRVLGVPSRLRILDALMSGALGMGELAAATGLEQSNLSRQVTELEREGCVARIRRGREVLVEIADPTLRALCALVCRAIEERAR